MQTSFVPSTGTVTDTNGRLGMSPLAPGTGACSQSMTIGIPGASADTTYAISSAGADGGGAGVTYQESCGTSSANEWYGVSGSITVNLVGSDNASVTLNAVQMQSAAGSGAFSMSGQITGNGSP
jgi:hypothetical protein